MPELAGKPYYRHISLIQIQIVIHSYYKCRPIYVALKYIKSR